MACLVVVEGPATGAMFSLAGYRLVDIGRDEECTFQIVDPQVSRHHLQILANSDGKHAAIDAGSANGVILNSVQIKSETPLNAGDEIVIGATRIVYSSADFPDAQRAMIGMRPGRQYKASTISRQ